MVDKLWMVACCSQISKEYCDSSRNQHNLPLFIAAGEVTVVQGIVKSPHSSESPIESMVVKLGKVEF